MSKPTQGPWTIDSFGNIKTPTGILRVKSGALPCGITSDRNEVMANTRLIAAAPDLLQALINALPNLHTGDELPMSYYADKKGVLGDALRAIAKAKKE
jgi:hypothetical protein